MKNWRCENYGCKEVPVIILWIFQWALLKNFHCISESTTYNQPIMMIRPNDICRRWWESSRWPHCWTVFLKPKLNPLSQYSFQILKNWCKCSKVGFYKLFASSTTLWVFLCRKITSNIAKSYQIFHFLEKFLFCNIWNDLLHRNSLSGRIRKS